MKILIADDDQAMRFFLTCILEEDLGFRVVAVPDGARAAQAIATAEFDAYVLDAFMPGVGGIELVEALGEHGLNASAIVISADLTLREAAESAGARLFLGKPFDYHDLVTALIGLKSTTP